MRRVAFVAACCATLIFVATPRVFAAAPSVYTQPAYESPLRGDPDDLLLIPGFGLAANDTVVYQTVSDTTHLPAHPASVPATSNATLGVADIVNAADAPYSLAVHLPAAMTSAQSYVLWVRAPDASWSAPILINDARPLWITPDSAYSTAALAGLPRVLKVVGRNLQPGPGTAAAAQVRLVGANTGTTYTLTAKNTANDSANTTAALERYVAEVSLPATLTVDHYSIQVSRDGNSWVPLLGDGRAAAQTFTVNADPPTLTPATTFRVDDARFADPVYGTCQPNDGKDDSYCILRALQAAAAATGGTVVFGPGTWNMSQPGTFTPGRDISDRMGSSVCGTPTELCGVSWYGILVPANINLQGQGATGTGATIIERGTGWVESDHNNSPLIGFTLLGNNTVTGINFVDDYDYSTGIAGARQLSLGLPWGRSRLFGATDPVVVSNVVITNNLFTRPYIAIGNGNLPTEHVYITSNTFAGAWNTGIAIGGDGNDDTNLTNPARPYDYTPYRFSDAVIAYNTFYPSNWQTSDGVTGPTATGIETSARLDFSHNRADGTNTQYLGSPPVPGWRGAYFWSTGMNADMTLVSSNSISCPGDKNGDGEAIVYDGDGHTKGGLPDAEPVITSAAWTDSSVSPAVPGTALTLQGTIITALPEPDNTVVDISANPTPFYRSYWVQVVQGKGKGQWRKVVSVATGSNSAGPTVTLNVTPALDVLPDTTSKVVLDHAYWQNATINNSVDQRSPCTKANTRGGGDGGVLSWYASTADSAMEGNQQYDTSGIWLSHGYHPVTTPQSASARAGWSILTTSEVRGNLIQGAYHFDNPNGTGGGVQLAFGALDKFCSTGNCAAPPPPVLGFGISVARNTIFQTDHLDLDGSHAPSGAIGTNPGWSTGPIDSSGASRWQMGDATLIFRNSLQNITHALSTSSTPRVGIGVDVAAGSTANPAISWRTTLYGNTCSNVDVPVSDFGTGTVRYCPTGAASNCECVGTASVDVGVSATSSASVAAGSTSTYTVKVTNRSTTTAASGVTLIVELSAGAVINAGSYTTTLGSCDSSVNVCNIGSLPAGQTVTVSLTANLATLGSWPVTFSVTHKEADPVAANDSVTLNELVGAAGVWKFDEGSGTTTTDASGSGNVGTLVNGPVWTTGKTGGALKFAAASSSVSVNGAGSLANLYNSGHGMTVAAWINPAGTGGGSGGRIVDKDNNNGGWFLKMNSTGTSVQFTADQFEASGMTPGAAAIRNSTASIVLNTWQHVAVTWDGTTNASNIHIFVNGVAADATSGLTNGSGVPGSDASTPFTIGNRPVDNARNFNGSIDGVRVYNRQLTLAEIQSLVSGGS